MTNEQMWKIFKNTGSIEAYISYAQSKAGMEKVSGKNCQDNGNNTENNRYTG